MNYTVFMPVLIAFAFSAILGPVIIPVLRKLKMGQTEREDGVKSHLKKAGTPYHGWRDHPFERGTLLPSFISKIIRRSSRSCL